MARAKSADIRSRACRVPASALIRRWDWDVIRIVPSTKPTTIRAMRRKTAMATSTSRMEKAPSAGNGANLRRFWDGRATGPVAVLPGKTSGTLVLLWLKLAAFPSAGVRREIPAFIPRSGVPRAPRSTAAARRPGRRTRAATPPTARRAGPPARCPGARRRAAQETSAAGRCPSARACWWLSSLRRQPRTSATSGAAWKGSKKQHRSVIAPSRPSERRVAAGVAARVAVGRGTGCERRAYARPRRACSTRLDATHPAVVRLLDATGGGAPTRCA